MRSRSRSRWLLFLALLSCGPEGAGPNDGVPVPSGDDALRFEQSGEIRISPAARMSFSLLGRDGEPARVWLEGAYLDGSLDRGSVELGEGRATIRLAAPSTPTTFAIRARQGDATTRLSIAVNPSGSALLRIRPKYDGPRVATSVVASIFVGRTCEDVTAGTLVDGTTPVSGLATESLAFPLVPAGVPLSVLARIERYAVGCARVDPLQADSTRELDLMIYDRPLDLTASFAIELGVQVTASEATSWHAALAPHATSWLDSFVAVGTDEGKWLLDAMLEDLATRVSQTAANEFATKRAAGGWNATTTSWMGARAPSIRTRTASLVDSAIQKPPTPLSLAIRPGSNLNKQALVTVTSLGARRVTGAWLSSPAPFDWTADAADVLSLAGALTIEPGTLVGFGADLAAAPSVDAAAALAQGIDCAGLAKALVGTGTSSTGCGLACTADLCRSGLALRARQASATVDTAPGVMSLGLTASAKARVGMSAEVLDIAGSWYGAVTLGASPFSIHGTLTGKPSP